MVELYVDEGGRLLTRRHPTEPRALMVCIRHDDTPVWINVDYLAHRNCDDCIDRWHARGLEYQKVAAAAPDATLFARTTLSTTDGHGDNVYLHARELPDLPGTSTETIQGTPAHDPRTREDSVSTPAAQLQDEDDAARLRDEGRSWSLVAQTLGVTEDTARLLAAASDRRVADLHQRQHALFDL
ncbi:hypothetical protein [Gordonia humi]|uniref:Uncharacterized protein n=1 Tax=Gordonia humi TaxID=686429 RepID=A0A840F896_9ACTN|nr:hypothetical protein [Gordonia humi]MBB4138106.1 hypothetical protein [Gordonia humi]